MLHEPGAWAGERTFHDTLYEWMERAPWLAISGAAHLLLYFLLAAIPWQSLEDERPRIVQANVLAPAEVLPEPIEPPPEPLPPTDSPEEPRLLSDELPADESEDLVSDVLDSADPFLEPTDFLPGDFAPIGLGPGFPPGSRHAPRGPGRGPGLGSGTAPALEDALSWLAAHQSPDGSWDADGFAARCGQLGAGTCDGPGAPTHDVGVTALALLAFLGDGHTQNEGAHRATVARALEWLLDAQDPDDGLLGERSSRDFLYDHAIATLALSEAYLFTHSPRLKRPTQQAVNVIFRARNPYGAWRYDLPPAGDSDTSVTGWMVFALASAQEARLEGDFRAAFEGALSWLDEVSDPASGLVGYSALGEASSRTPANEHFPRETGEAMTAVGLLCRIFLDQTPESHPILARHAERIRARPPLWDPDGFRVDFYYWYYGTYALYQMGKPWWPTWEKAMRAALLDSQRKDGDARGSWDPSDAWGYSGGRVVSTALMTLSLEVTFRYTRILGAR